MLIALPLHYLYTLYKNADPPTPWVRLRDLGPYITYSHLLYRIYPTSWLKTRVQIMVYWLFFSYSVFLRSNVGGKIAKLTIIFKLKLNHMHSPNSPLRSPSPPPYSLRHYDPHNYLPIIWKTHSFSNSFYPTAINSAWNSLPSPTKSWVTPSLFKSRVKTIIF